MNDFVAVEAGIRQLHARYADAVWRKDVESFADCFVEDAIWKIAGKDICGRATIKASIGSILSNANRILMTFRTPIVNIDEDGAVSARTYVTEDCSWLNGNANSSIGRYYERFVMDEGRWRFAWRLFELHYSGPPDLSGEYRHHHPDFGPPPAMPPLDYVSVDWPSTNWKKD